MRNFVVLLLVLLTINGQGEDSSEEKKRARQYFAGRFVFEQNCSQCHGKLGKGDGEWAEGWTANRPRNFRTGIYKFRSTPMGKLPTDQDLRRTIEVGISGTAMPAFGDHLRDEEYEAVIEYLKHLSRRWRAPENVAKPLVVDKIPDWVETDRETSEAHLTAGKELYLTHCLSCHGENGEGDGLAAGALVDVWGQKIVPADFTSKHRKSGLGAGDLYRTISMGLDGTPMVGFQSVLKEEQIWELILYIQSLKTER